MSHGSKGKEVDLALGVEELKTASTPVWGFLGLLVILLFAVVPGTGEQIIHDYHDAGGSGGGAGH